jgi:AcrR family transcriptional regulator
MTDADVDGISSIARRRSQARREGGAGYLERRQQFLAAAAEVFRTKGYQAASMNDIAVRSGGDRASLYYYFGSKQEVFTELVRQAVTDNVALAERIAASDDSSVARLRIMVVSLIESYERHYPYLHLYVQEDMRRLSEGGAESDQDLVDMGRRYTRAVSAVAHEGVASGEFRRDIDPEMLTFAVLGAVNWCHRWFVPGGRLTGTQVGEAFADIVLHGAVADPGQGPSKAR